MASSMHDFSIASRWLAWTLAWALLGPASAFGQSPALEMPKDATPLMVVTPEFPAGATAPAGGVRVDVSGTVRADGSFDPRAITAEGQPEAYVAAVAGVVKHWRFLPAVDDERCVPIDSPSTLSVWFEGSAAAPKIFVSRPKDPPPVEPPPYESVWAPRMSFSGNAEGQVRVLMLVSPEGRVKAANVRSSEPRGRFDSIVLRNALRTEVTWRSPGPARDLCAQREYRLCLGPGPGVDHRHRACGDLR